MTGAQMDTGSEGPRLAVVPHPCAEQGDRELLKRFVAQSDAGAFEALVHRYGPLVLGVCRRMLRDHHAADDAFQATFLVLFRRAASIRQPDLLGNWLYGVAYRIACRARMQIAKRHDVEMRTPLMSQYNVAEQSVDQEMQRRELREALDEAISQLPRAYRDTFVLCCVQNRTQAEAARLMGCPIGSISSRLSTARERIRVRLSQRGLALSTGLLATLLGDQLSATEPSQTLLDRSVQLATSQVAKGGLGGSATASLASARATHWADAVIREMQWRSLTQAGLAVAGGLLVCLLAYQSITFTVESSASTGTLEHRLSEIGGNTVGLQHSEDAASARSDLAAVSPGASHSSGTPPARTDSTPFGSCGSR